MQVRSLTGGGWSMYLAKYNKHGQLLWAKSDGGNYADFAEDLAVDKSGNIYLTGHFGILDVVFDTINLKYSGGSGSDIYMVKYDNDGNAIWARSVIGNDHEEGNRIEVDSMGNVYIAGRFNSNSLIFDTDTLIRFQGTDTYVAKFDKDGKGVWAKSAGAVGIDSPKGITLDSDNYIWITGYYKTGPFYIGNDSLTGSGPNDKVFVAKIQDDAGLDYIEKDILCNGDGDGEIDLIPIGRNQDYSFLWSTGETTEDLNNLAPGMYIVTANETVRNCTIIDTFYITEPPPLAVTFEVQDDSAYKHLGWAHAIVSGGVPPYTYLWGDYLQQKTAKAIEFMIGTYGVTITDANGCILDTSASIGDKTQSTRESNFSKNFRIYPNPNENSIIILEINDIESRNAEIMIYNNLGDIVINEKLRLSKRNMINLPKDSKGLHYLRIVIDNETITKPFVIH